MALGKIKADTLEHSTAGSITTDYVVNGSAKAWVNFNGTGTIAERDSLNLASLTDNGTGDYSVTMSSAMANANYSFQGTASQAGTGNNGQIFSILASTAPTTTLVQFRTQQDNVGVTDSEYVCLAVFGDLS